MHEDNINPNQIASVKQMAAMLHISRSRLYQLVHANILLPPIYDLHTKRPFYPADLIMRNMDAKRLNRGINGQPVLFYTARACASTKPKARAKSTKVVSNGKHTALIDGLRSLGMDAADADVDAALVVVYGNDRGASVDEGERLRQVFRHLRGRNVRQNRELNVRT